MTHSAIKCKFLKCVYSKQNKTLTTASSPLLPLPRSVVLQWISAAPYPQVVEFGPWQPGSTNAEKVEEGGDPCAAAALASQPGSGNTQSESAQSGSTQSGAGCRGLGEEEGMGAGGAASSSSSNSESGEFGFSSGAQDAGIKPDSVQPVTCIKQQGDHDSYLFRWA